MRKFSQVALAGVSLIGLMQPLQALAQDQAPADEAAADDGKEIIVTGTLIRGIAPAGSNVIGVDSRQIEATGASTTSQVLANTPQIGNFFNQLPAGVSGTSGSNINVPINRPNLRNLPGANTSGGAQTLVLLDGHRVVGAGITQVAVDPDVIAPGVIERVEAMTDGGSAVYGSDALGGVINFISRKRFDGVRVGGHYGFADDFQTWDANAMVGRDWGTGGLYVAYGYTTHDAVFGIDRDWVRRVDWTGGVPGVAVGRACANPNITVGTTSYVVSGSGIVTGGPNVCDPSDDTAIYPESTSHTVFARLNQDLNDWVHVDITAFYANRKILGQGGTLGSGALGSGAEANVSVPCNLAGTVAVPGTCNNPVYRSTGGATAFSNQAVRFNYGPVFGFRSAAQKTNLEEFNINPSLAFDLGSGWQLRTLFGYGRAKIDYANTQIKASAQAAGIGNGTLNPYNVSASSATTLAGLIGIDRGYGRNEFYDYRAIIDGPLFTLPGGELRIAFGGEHLHDNFSRVSTSAATYALLTPNTYVQKVDSLFGEVQIPIFGADNSTPFFRELSISASARYDKYNDFGDTFNPKIGVTWKPIEQLKLFGNWGKSFNAPSPTDQLGIFNTFASPVPGAFLQAPPSVPNVCGGSLPACSIAGTTGIFINGTAPGIQPQRAESWSVGAELKPFDGVALGGSFYHIDLSGTIGRPVTGTGLAPYYNGFPALWIYQPSGVQVANFLVSQGVNPALISFTLLNPTSNAQASISTGGGPATPVGVILDTSSRNLGATSLDGLDFFANFRHDTGFGSIDAGIAGNYRIRQKTLATPTSALFNDLAADISRFTFGANAGATIGGFRAQATWNHTSSYNRGDGATPGAFGQTRVKAYDQVNLFFKFDVPESLIGSDLQFTLNVQNLFDVNPPIYFATTFPGYNNSGGSAFTIGRMIQFGVSTKF